jgi:hypothetical protein
MTHDEGGEEVKLDRVTISGADDRVDPRELARLGLAFPFVEWGVLLSRTQAGRPRYPTEGWIAALAAEGAAIAGHLCGGWARDVAVQGILAFRRERPALWPLLGRVQLNSGPMRAEARPAELVQAILEQGEGRTFILQATGAADPVVAEARRQGLAAHVLFDASHGRGEVAASWPAALPGIHCGYAGGLGPDNLQEQLSRIAEAAGDSTVWIDMESRVRTSGDEFDLVKVTRVLEIAAGFIGA